MARHHSQRRRLSNQFRSDAEWYRERRSLGEVFCRPLDFQRNFFLARQYSTSSTSAATSAAASTAFPSHVSRSSDTNGLTPGSKAGISLGTIGSVALVGTLSGLVFLYYRKYKRKRSRADRWLPEPPQQKQAAEVHPVVEMDEGTRKHELDGNTACLRPELSASGSVEKRRIHELPG